MKHLSSIHNSPTGPNMPVHTLFHQRPKFDIVVLVQTRNTDSTLDTQELFTKEFDFAPLPRSASPSTPAKEQQDFPSAFRASQYAVESPLEEDMWMIRRCNAFEEDGEDY
jgi:hypothetical protein